MNFLRTFRIHLGQHLVKISHSLFLGKGFQAGPVSVILFCLGKIDIPGHCLNIKSRTANQDWNMPVGVNLFHGILCHLLKTHNVKFILWHQRIHKIVRDSLHFFWHNLG